MYLSTVFLILCHWLTHQQMDFVLGFTGTLTQTSTLV